MLLRSRIAVLVFRLHDDKNYHRVLYLQSFPLASFWPSSGNCQNPPLIHCRSSISFGCCRKQEYPQLSQIRICQACKNDCLLSNFLNTRIFLILRWNNVVISISCPKIQGRWMCSSQTFEFSFVSLWSSNQLMANPQSWWNCNNKKGVKIRKGRA